jgi:hypothetical protein
MSDIYFQNKYKSFLYPALEKSKKEISLSFILLDLIPVYFIIRPYLIFKLTRGYKKMRSDLDYIYNSFIILPDDELAKVHSDFLKLNSSLNNFVELTNQSKYFPQKTKDIIGAVSNKMELIIEMIEINLNNELIKELNDAVAEIK